MSGAIPSFGTFLQLGDGGSPEAFTTVAEVKDISGPELSLDREEVTSHSSVGAFKEYIATLLDGGEVSFPINLIPTHPTHDGTTGLYAVIKNRRLANWRLLLTDNPSSRWEFKAHVTRFTGGSPVSGAQGAEITLSISGVPELIPGA